MAFRFLTCVALLAFNSCNGTRSQELSDLHSASSPYDTQIVQNFKLLDHLGGSHELRHYSNKKAVVLFVQGNGCPIVRRYIPTLKKISENFGEQVSFLMLNSSIQDSREDILEETQEFDIPFPVLKDRGQAIGITIGLNRTAEVLVLNPKDWSIAYRGPVDNSLDYEGRKNATAFYLQWALNSLVTHKEKFSLKGPEVKGCLIRSAN